MTNAWAEEPEYEGRGDRVDVERLYSTLVLLRERRRGRVPFSDYDRALIMSATVKEYDPGDGRWIQRLIRYSPSVSRTLPCPTCGAAEGKGCKSRTDKPAEAHAARSAAVVELMSERDLYLAVLEVAAYVRDDGRTVVVESETTLVPAEKTLCDLVGGVKAVAAEYEGRLDGVSP